MGCVNSTRSQKYSSARNYFSSLTDFVFNLHSWVMNLSKFINNKKIYKFSSFMSKIHNFTI